MSSFKQFVDLTEAKVEDGAPSKVAVFAFGRFNPPTKGHGKLIDKVAAVAKEKGGQAFIFPSQTVDKPAKKTGKVDPEKSKNPLDYNTKVVMMKEAFPDANIIKAPEVKTPHDVITWLEAKGFTDVIFVVGSDRVEEFANRWLPYANDTFNNSAVTSAGVRDADSEGVVGMSASKAREAAKTGDLAKFTVATGWDGDLARNMLKAVRKGMGLD